MSMSRKNISKLKLGKFSNLGLDDVEDGKQGNIRYEHHCLVLLMIDAEKKGSKDQLLDEQDVDLKNLINGRASDQTYLPIVKTSYAMFPIHS